MHGYTTGLQLLCPVRDINSALSSAALHGYTTGLHLLCPARDINSALAPVALHGYNTAVPELFLRASGTIVPLFVLSIAQ